MNPDYIRNLNSISIRLFMQVGAIHASSHCTFARDKSFPPALEIFGLGSRCLNLNADIQDALRVLVRGVGLSSYLQESADVEPSPDPGYDKARNSWPFVIQRDSDKLGAVVTVWYRSLYFSLFRLCSLFSQILLTLCCTGLQYQCFLPCIGARRSNPNGAAWKEA